MIIQYYGHEFFKVQFGDTVLAFNPISKSSKLKSASFGADIALVTLNHPDMNGPQTVARGDKEPFVITGSGEYEVSGVRIHGFPSVSNYSGREEIHTIYLVELEDMHLLYLGALDGEIGTDVLEEIDVVDILFVPIGGKGVLDTKAAHKLAVKLESHVVIPMHYTDADLKTFLKEEGGESVQPVDKITLKQKDVSALDGAITVLKSLS